MYDVGSADYDGAVAFLKGSSTGETCAVTEVGVFFTDEERVFHPPGRRRFFGLDLVHNYDAHTESFTVTGFVAEKADSCFEFSAIFVVDYFFLSFESCYVSNAFELVGV